MAVPFDRYPMALAFRFTNAIMAIYPPYRPVLSGERLQRELGYRPKSSREAFETYRHAHVCLLLRQGRRRHGRGERHRPRLGDRPRRPRARVALLDVDGEGAEREAATLPHEALGLRCDVTDAADCARAIEAVVARWGGVDLLVNNAGINHHSPASVSR